MVLKVVIKNENPNIMAAPAAKELMLGQHSAACRYLGNRGYSVRRSDVTR